MHTAARKGEKNIAETPVTLVRQPRETANSRSNFYPFGPRPSWRRTRIRWRCEAPRKGRWWLLASGNFSEKRVSDTWPTYEGRRWLRKWCVLWFYNANGWPKRGSRDETVTHGCSSVHRSFLITPVRVCVSTTYGKGMTVLRLSTTKLGNEPSRRPGLGFTSQ